MWRIAALAAVLALCAGCGSDPTPAEFVNDQGSVAHSVVVSVDGVQQGTALYTSDPAGSAVSFQQLLSTTKDSLSDARSAISLADPPSGLDDAKTEMFTAVDDLAAAIDSDRAYVDNQRPSDLADFGTKWKQGRVAWNDAVTKIWNAAGSTPPTVSAD